MKLETERLIFRPLDDRDLQDLAEMLQDPEVVYAYGHEFNDDEVREWLVRQKDRMARFNFSLCALISKAEGVMIGQAGLTWQQCEGRKVLEIGYMLKKKYWHQGYAREAAVALRDYAFERLRAERVHSIIKTDNEPSRRVAEAIGLKCEKEFTARYYHGDMRHVLYTMSTDDWKNRKSERMD